MVGNEPPPAASLHPDPLLPEDLWWAPSPGCPPPTPGKEVRSALGGQPHFGTEESDINLHYKGLQRDYYGAVQRSTIQELTQSHYDGNFFTSVWNLGRFIELETATHHRV